MFNISIFEIESKPSGQQVADSPKVEMSLYSIESAPEPPQVQEQKAARKNDSSQDLVILSDDDDNFSNKKPLNNYKVQESKINTVKFFIFYRFKKVFNFVYF
jgi:hypothetical protein